MSTTADNVRPAGSSKPPTDARVLLTARPKPTRPSPTTELPFVQTEQPQFITTPTRTIRPLLRDIVSRPSQTPRRPRPTTPAPTTPRRRVPRPTTIAPLITSTTRKPRPVVTRAPRPQTPRPVTPQVNVRPASNIFDYEYDYIYYDDTGALSGALGQLAEFSEKAVLLPDGSVECYDTGYFAHPDSCKKFISCSKTVKGLIKGWVYTCPAQLVFDPVGGMCNWAEAVDCLTV